MHHIPGYLVAGCHPVILVNGRIAFYGYKTVLFCKLTISIRSAYADVLILFKPLSCFTDQGKGLRTNIFQNAFGYFVSFFFQRINFIPILLAVVNIFFVLYLLFKLDNSFGLRLYGFGYPGFEFVCFGTQLVIRQLLNLGLNSQYLLQLWL